MRSLTPPARDAVADWVQHPDYFAGKDAIGRGDPAAARDAFSRVLAERPAQLDARAGLAQALHLLGEPGSAALVEAVLGDALSGSRELLLVTLDELAPAAEAGALRPSIAWRVAQRLDAAGDGQGALPYFQVASASDGLLGLKARVRSLELDPEPSLSALSAAADLTAREPELHRRVTALIGKHAPAERRTIELPADDADLKVDPGQAPKPAPPAPPPPRIVTVRIEALTGSGLVVVSAGGTNPVPFTRILGVAVGAVPGTAGRVRVLTDLVLAWAVDRKPTTVLRASLADLGLDRLYPGVPQKEAYWRLVGDIEKASGAKRLPAGTPAGELPRYASPAEMTRICHGPR